MPKIVAFSFLMQFAIDNNKRKEKCNGYIDKSGANFADTKLTSGKQGIRKSTFVQELFGYDFTRTQMPDLSSKDASLALHDEDVAHRAAFQP